METLKKFHNDDNYNCPKYQKYCINIQNVHDDDKCPVKHGPSPPGTFHILIGKFSYFVIRFLNQIFLSLTFPILLSDFTIELLGKNLITK